MQYQPEGSSAKEVNCVISWATGKRCHLSPSPPPYPVAYVGFYVAVNLKEVLQRRVIIILVMFGLLPLWHVGGEGSTTRVKFSIGSCCGLQTTPPTGSWSSACICGWENGTPFHNTACVGLARVSNYCGSVSCCK